MTSIWTAVSICPKLSPHSAVCSGKFGQFPSPPSAITAYSADVGGPLRTDEAVVVLPVAIHPCDVERLATNACIPATNKHFCVTLVITSRSNCRYEGFDGATPSLQLHPVRFSARNRRRLSGSSGKEWDSCVQMEQRAIFN